ncbi:hypothetical protein DPMN_010601 [Dreissena polymorpha]|uniref:Reverse transcriptase/retrotransposon-derived protein RNase H-like domain-containing protein n=1 Tax=Dreissena polymorpha TaxID=45954 RepID=A0A9D4S137_DREPO|nr:hypothetical protein DPMN_010601 [Dreissena polymorpha]
MEAGRAFNVGDEQESAFVDLKTVLTGKEVMSYPQDDGIFIVDTDASNFAIGGC